jgi:XRE family transcriptional regulator, regulator of sulfur utilization
MSDAGLGPAVRRLREARGLSLRALGELTGFSASFLSQVENGQASPSIASMERIAGALGVTLGQFFDGAGRDRRGVTRAGARPTLQSEWSRGRIESLGPVEEGGRLEPVVVTLEPGGSSGKRPAPGRHEEFTLVLEGTVELTLEDGAQTLGPGDAITIRAGALRRWHNPGAAAARFLIVAAR